MEGRKSILAWPIFIYCARWIKKYVPRKLIHAGVPPLFQQKMRGFPQFDMVCPTTLP